jgi:predicted Zn-dependent protease
VRRFPVAAAAIVAAGAAFGCSGAKPAPRAAARREPVPEAAATEGRDLASGLFGRDPLVADDRLLRYVALVGRTCGGRRVDGWRFAVTQSAVPYATAFPGGIVVVSRGLLLLVRSEAELAVVLSREIRRGETAPAREFPGPAPESGDPARETTLDAAGARLASAAGYDAAAFLHLLDMLQDRAASAREKSEIQERTGAYRTLPETSAGGRMLAERYRSSAIV